VLVLLAALLWPAGACGGAEAPPAHDVPAPEPMDVVGERSYARLPTSLFGGQVEASRVGPELVQCYEAESRTGTWDVTAVLFELVWDGQHVRPRLSQQADDFSNRVAACVEEVTVGWHLQPETLDVGSIHPVELGPLR
jgi:hypothetical protein